MNTLPSWTRKEDRVKHGVDMADDTLICQAAFVSMEKVRNVEEACELLDEYSTILTIVCNSERVINCKLRENEVVLSSESKKRLCDTFRKLKMYERKTLRLNEGCITIVKFEE